MQLKMKPKWKRIWLKALRSGEYDQTTRQMCNSEGTAFCCLGVLCNEVAIENKGIDYGFVTSYVGPLLTFSDKNNVLCSGYLPRGVEDLVSLHPVNQANLVTMNDITKASFEEIANWIEENL